MNDELRLARYLLQVVTMSSYALQKVLQSLQHCGLCGSWPSGEGACRNCLDYWCKRLQQSSIQLREVRGYPLASLLVWRKQDQALTYLIHQLKGQDRPDGWNLFAEHLIWRLLRVGGFWGDARLWRSASIVPAPPRTAERLHALGWARALGAVTGLKVRSEVLKVSELRAQKEKNLIERHQSKALTLGVELSELRALKARGPILFVDDVCTSGATAQAAFETMGRPKGFGVVTMAYRDLERISCGAPSSLI